MCNTKAAVNTINVDFLTHTKDLWATVHISYPLKLSFEMDIFEAQWVPIRNTTWVDHNLFNLECSAAIDSTHFVSRIYPRIRRTGLNSMYIGLFFSCDTLDIYQPHVSVAYSHRGCAETLNELEIRLSEMQCCERWVSQLRFLQHPYKLQPSAFCPLMRDFFFPMLRAVYGYVLHGSLEYDVLHSSHISW